MGAQKITLPIKNKDVEDLIMWRDVKKTGMVFGSVTLVYLLFEWSGLSLMTIVANILLVVTLGCLLWANVASLLGRAGPPIPRALKEGVDEAELKDMAVRMQAPINKVLSFIAQIASGKEWKLSLAVGAGLWLLGKLGAYFTVLGFIYTVALLLFTLPRAYEEKKEEVDRALESAVKEGKRHLLTARSSMMESARKLPPAAKQFVERFAPSRTPTPPPQPDFSDKTE